MSSQTSFTAEQKQLDTFINKFAGNVAAAARVEIGRMRALLPTATELVYDNYNALAIGFGPSEKTSEAIFSLAVYPKWVTLFFLHGATMPDPKKLLCGEGAAVRHIRLNDPNLLLSDDVRALMQTALKQAPIPIMPTMRRKLVIKSISPQQRPRR